MHVSSHIKPCTLHCGFILGPSPTLMAVVLATAYAGYDESGSGALRNVETSGGNHSERYLQHLVMHNNRLILENGRLYVCIEMLSSDPSMIPDEVVCHIFALNEEEFIRRYPSIGELSQNLSLI